MKRLLLALIVSAALAGCNSQQPRSTQAPLAASRPGPDKAILSTTVTPGSAIKMSVSFDPPQPRMSTKTAFRLTLTDLSGAPVTDAKVQASLVMPLMDMGKNEFVLQPAGRGIYAGTGQFTMSGEWEAVFTATAAGKTGKTTFNVQVED